MIDLPAAFVGWLDGLRAKHKKTVSKHKKLAFLSEDLKIFRSGLEDDEEEEMLTSTIRFDRLESLDLLLFSVIVLKIKGHECVEVRDAHFVFGGAAKIATL